MVKLLVTYDDQDVVLGSFFGRCRESIEQIINAIHDYEMESIDSRNITKAYFDITLPAKPRPFIKVVYSHGNSTSFVNKDGEAFIKQNVNASLFENTLVYSVSCNVGQSLGVSLVNEENCKAFVGYKDEVHIYTNWHDVFSNCANSGLIYYLQNNSTIEEAVNFMKDAYTDAYDKFIDDYPIVAAGLYHNKIALVLEGNKGLVKEQLQS